MKKQANDAATVRARWCSAIPGCLTRQRGSHVFCGAVASRAGSDGFRRPAQVHAQGMSQAEHDQPPCFEAWQRQPALPQRQRTARVVHEAATGQPSVVERLGRRHCQRCTGGGDWAFIQAQPKPIWRKWCQVRSPHNSQARGLSANSCDVWFEPKPQSWAWGWQATGKCVGSLRCCGRAEYPGGASLAAGQRYAACSRHCGTACDSIWPPNSGTLLHGLLGCPSS